MYEYKCKVVKVVDGDTLDIVVDLGFEIRLTERVRLINVNTPEIFGPKATEEGKIASLFVTEWYSSRVGGHFVYSSVKYNSRDKYGRSLGYIIHVGDDGKVDSLNDALVLKGW